MEGQSPQLAVCMKHGLPATMDRETATTKPKLAVDKSGNVYVAGYGWGSGTLNDYATIKYDPIGHEQWVARYYGPDNPDDQLNAMTTDDSGNVYVTGRSGTNN